MTVRRLFIVTVATPSFRAIVIVGGVLRQIQDSELGTLKPIVLLGDTLKQRVTTEGIPVIIDNGILRTLASGESLIV